jgi:hypothetical protein
MGPEDTSMRPPGILLSGLRTYCYEAELILIINHEIETDYTKRISVYSPSTN